MIYLQTQNNDIRGNALIKPIYIIIVSQKIIETAAKPEAA